MKKLVRTNLTNSPSRRGTENLNIQFYSHDKNNAGFEFVVKNETDLSQYTPKVLFKFRDSNSTWQANGTVEGNVVKVNFNTDLIARCEEVLGFLFLDSDSDSLDVFKFKFNVVLSEIDKGEVANRQIKHVNNIGELELVTKSQLTEELSKLKIDSALVERVAALENRPSTGGGNVDTSNFVTKKAFDDEIGKINETYIPHPLYVDYKEQETAKEYLDSIPILFEKPRISYSAGSILAKMLENSNYPQNVQIFKGDENNEKFVDFDAAMYSLANSLPDNYNLGSVRDDINNKVIFLSNKNFSEVVPVEQLKNIIREVGLTGDSNENRQPVDSSNKIELQTNQYELRGTGMPNGVVEAPIGATYIDTAKTNGALKWIKTTDGGNTGWKVVEGDTGWITIFQGKVWRDFINRLMIRRINNTVNVLFEGLGDAEGIFFDKTAHPHNLDLVNVKVVDGFKPISRITLPTLNYASFYDEDGVFTIGTITFDVIDGMFKITLFSEQDRVNRMSNGLANINFNYVTYEEWPVQLL